MRQWVRDRKFRSMDEGGDRPWLAMRVDRPGGPAGKASPARATLQRAPRAATR